MGAVISVYVAVSGEKMAFEQTKKYKLIKLCFLWSSCHRKALKYSNVHSEYICVRFAVLF